MKLKKPLQELKLSVPVQETSVANFLYFLVLYLKLAYHLVVNYDLLIASVIFQNCWCFDNSLVLYEFLSTYCFEFRTASGTFHDGDLLLNQKGLRLISEENDSTVS